MRRIVILLLVSFTSIAAATAQSNSTSFFSDIEEAKAYAKQENKNILVVFSGSDWCRPCIQFKKEILENTEFKKYAASNLAVLYLDFPMRKKNKLPEDQTKHNEALAEKYNKGGAFPKLLIMDDTEAVLGELTFHNQGTSNFIQSCKTVVQ